MRVLLIDDHALVSEALAQSLLACGAASQAVVFSSVDTAVAYLADGNRCDFILIDWHLPGLHGEAAIHAMQEAAPGTPIAVCSGAENPEVAGTALAAGSRGFLPKTMKVEQLSAAIRLIASGAVYVPPEFAARAFARPDTDLTDRELEVIRGVAKGRSNKELGLELDLAEVTIKLHMRRAMKKLGVTNRTQAAIKARDLGIA